MQVLFQRSQFIGTQVSFFDLLDHALQKFFRRFPHQAVIGGIHDFRVAVQTGLQFCLAGVGSTHLVDQFLRTGAGCLKGHNNGNVRKIVGIFATHLLADLVNGRFGGIIGKVLPQQFLQMVYFNFCRIQTLDKARFFRLVIVDLFYRFLCDFIQTDDRCQLTLIQCAGISFVLIDSTFYFLQCGICSSNASSLHYFS